MWNGDLPVFLFLSYAMLWYPVISDVSKTKSLPEGIPHCRDVVNINLCLKSAIEEMLPRLKDGDKTLNIPPLDPFVLERSNYRYSRGNIQGRLALRNLKILGISTTQVKYIDFQVTELGTKMVSEVFTPKISVQGQYKAEFKFNEIKLQPKGNFTVIMIGTKSRNVMEGEFVKNNTERYLKLKSMNIVSPEIEDMKIRVSGLFPDPRLNTIFEEAANQYWRQLYKVLIPETRQYWEPIMIAMANEFLTTYPFEELITISKNN